jgi:hypothetical protein
MSLPSFQQWLAERGKRTALGIYPPLYGVGQYPPLAFAPVSTSHLVAFAKIHGDVHPDLLSEPIKKEFEKTKKVEKKKDKKKKVMSLEELRALKK